MKDEESITPESCLRVSLFLVSRRISSGFEPDERVIGRMGVQVLPAALRKMQSAECRRMSLGARIGSGFYPVRRNRTMRVRVLPGAWALKK